MNFGAGTRGRPLRERRAPVCHRVGRAAQTTCALLGLSCAVFGVVLAAFDQGSVEERIGALFLFGLIPALGLCVGGYILRLLVVSICKLCEIIAAGAFHALLAIAGRSARSTGVLVRRAFAERARPGTA